MTEEKQVTVWNNDKQISAQFDAAMGFFKDGVIPKTALSTRQGPNARTFTYISHTWVTEQLVTAFGPMWSMEVLNTTSYPGDHSATAIVRLINYIPDKDGNIHEVHIDECGAFLDQTKKMSQAYRIASAVSRGLVKCVMRRTRCGISLYNNEYQPTAAEATRALIRAAKRYNIPEKALIAHFQEHGLSSENILDRYEEAYSLLYGLRQVADAEEVRKVFKTETPAPAAATKPAAPEKKKGELNKTQLGLLNFMIATLKIETEERGFAAKVKAVNERLAKREYETIDSLTDKQCAKIRARLRAATSPKEEQAESANPQHGPLADKDMLDALLTWTHDMFGITGERVLDALNEMLELEKLPEALGFEFVPWNLKECQNKIQEWMEID